jgi:hypothetical protein
MQLKDLITDAGFELTGILPGVKIEHPIIDLNPSVEDVEKYWKKVKWITNQKQFDKKKRSVFQSNINRSKIFLKNML